MSRKEKNALLWELLPPDGGKSSYLFGTIHLPDLELFNRIDQVKSIMPFCDSFMAEYNMDENSPALQASLLIADNQTLDSILGSKKYQKLGASLFKAFGVDISLYRKLKPLILEQVLAETLIDLPSGAPMDTILWNHAGQIGLHKVGAESLDSQVKILEHFPINIQLRALLKISSNPAKFKKMLSKLKANYIEEEIHELYKSSKGGLGKMRQTLLYKRNYIITDSISKFAQVSSVLCAVGAGHLHGYKGILRLLKHKGFKIKPMKRED